MAAPADSPILIRLVNPGTPAQPAAELAMLQMTVDGQDDVAGQTLDFYGPGGNPTARFVLPVGVANGLTHRTVLLATAAAAAQSEFPPPDFTLPSGDALDPGAGAVCFSGAYPADCVSWGHFPELARLALPDPQRASAPAIQGDKGLARRIDLECPTWLNPRDDVGDGAADFADDVPPPKTGMFPVPRPNAAAGGESPCLPNSEVGVAPPNPSNDPTPTFGLIEDPREYGIRFECRSGAPPLDGQAFAPCPRDVTLGPLADGSYEIQARAVGKGGTDSTPDSRRFSIDTVPPDTVVTGVPPEPSDGFSASFSFRSTEPFSHFFCQFEAGPVQPCESPKTLFTLADGPHSFRIWAADQARNQDPTPALVRFTVDTALGDVTPPDTSIIARPKDPASSPRASFGYRSSEPRSSFQCRIDGRPFTACPASGASYAEIANGSHSFAVRAIDRAGNVDTVPAVYTWEVAAPLPNTRIVAAPPGARRIKPGAKARRVRFAFRADKPGSRFRCRLDQRPFRACRSPAKRTVGPGRHRFEVHAIDSIGNVEATPARRIFRILPARAGGFFRGSP